MKYLSLFSGIGGFELGIQQAYEQICGTQNKGEGIQGTGSAERRSGERLQGFPDSWTEGVSDTQRYKTLGNAVTVSVIKEITRKLF